LHVGHGRVLFNNFLFFFLGLKLETKCSLNLTWPFKKWWRVWKTTHFLQAHCIHFRRKNRCSTLSMLSIYKRTISFKKEIDNFSTLQIMFRFVKHLEKIYSVFNIFQFFAKTCLNWNIHKKPLFIITHIIMLNKKT
jgi:hypothetical protein